MSITITGLAVFIVGRLLESSGLAPDNAAITNFVEVGFQIVGALMIWFGRYRQGDINIFGRKLK